MAPHISQPKVSRHMGQAQCCSSRRTSSFFDEFPIPFAEAVVDDEIWHDAKENLDVWHDVVEADASKSSTLPICKGKLTLGDILNAGVPDDAAEGVLQLAAVVAGVCKGMDDPLTLLRYYIAYGRDVHAAERLYRSQMEWRQHYRIGRIMAAHGSGEEYRCDGSPCNLPGSWRWERKPITYEAVLADRHAFFGRLRHAVDPVDGGAILVWRFGVADVGALQREGLLDGFKRALVSHIEDCFQSLRAASQRKKQLVCARVVMDAKGLGLDFLRHLKTVHELVSYCISKFPETVKSVTVVRAPWLCAQLWKTLQPLVPARTRSKFLLLGDGFEEALEVHSGLKVEMLPQFLGGLGDDDEVCSAKWVPDGTGKTLPIPSYHEHLYP
eukprot:TRINITY_DN29471_c0_g3_i3.p1 TRINITY_DN29471_c0_g3~~TRINITY_DN29471_c0_g3_i3.p1  ORF type:complete len:392 (+),score=24.01 TRINITY_DN29471_c0_g3_i3:30-1178(+)